MIPPPVCTGSRSDGPVVRMRRCVARVAAQHSRESKANERQQTSRQSNQEGREPL